MSLESAMAAAGGAPATEAKSSETPNSSPQTPATPVAEPPKETASSILAKLAREKKEKLDLSRKVTERDSEKSQLEARIKELEGRVGGKPKNPIEALMAAGYSYKDATDFVLNNQELTPSQQVKLVQEELAELKKKQEEKEAQAKESEQQRLKAQYDQTISDFKDEISDFVEANKEKFELTHLYGGQELIYETIAGHYEQSLKEWRENGSQGKPPRVLSKEEAADLVEKHYEEEIEKLKSVEKVKKKFVPEPSPEGGQKPGTPAPKTLSNTVTSSAAPQGGRINDPIARAMAALDRMGK